MRALLFVPADSPRKLERALGAGADALIIDLEDSVALERKVEARLAAAEYLLAARRAAAQSRLYVRVNALDTPFAADDLAAIIAMRPDGVMLPKARGGDDVRALDEAITALEAAAGVRDRPTRILPLITETAISLLNLASYPGSSDRLSGLTWGAEDLAAELGAATNRDLATGHYTSPFRLARDLCLFTAAACGVPAIDTVFTHFRDPDALASEAAEAARDGFSGKLAIHPDQVAVIHAAFTPRPDDVARARAIVAAFAMAGDVGVVALDGRMIDRPHLKWAERVLQRA